MTTAGERHMRTWRRINRWRDLTGAAAQPPCYPPPLGAEKQEAWRAGYGAALRALGELQEQGRLRG